MGIELERKWRVSKNIVRKYNFNLKYKIRQNYIKIKGNKESRIREITEIDSNCYFNQIYILERKNRSSNNKAKEEKMIVNEIIGKEFIQSEIYGEPIYKNRYLISEPNKYFTSNVSNNNSIKEAVIDVFIEPPLDYAVLEIEFTGKEAMDNFVKPVWFGEEVDIKNSDIWMKLNNEEQN